MEIQEPFQEPGFIRWRRFFPWLHLLRVPGIAGRFSLLLCGLVACYLLMTLDVFTLGYTSRDQIPHLTVVSENFLKTMLNVAAPNSTAYILSSIWLGNEHSVFLLNFFVSLGIHLLTGLMICRLAAQAFATGNGRSLEEAAGFTLRKFPEALKALFFPSLTIFILYQLCHLCLLAEKIPGAGPWIAGLLYGPALLCLFLAILLLAGLVVGWPLMIAALAVENSDGFDAWSRTYDYLRSRFFPILGGFLVTVLMGLFVLVLFSELTSFTFAGINNLQASVLNMPVSAIAERNTLTLQQGPVGLQNLWKTLWICLLNGYFHTIYWATVTALYFLVRYSVDRVALTETR